MLEGEEINQLTLKKNRRSFFNTVKPQRDNMILTIDAKTVKNPLFLKKQVSTNNLYDYNQPLKRDEMTISSDKILIKQNSTEELLNRSSEGDMKTQSLPTIRKNSSLPNGSFINQQTNPLYNTKKVEKNVEEILNKHLSQKVDRTNLLNEISNPNEVLQKINPLYNKNRVEDIISKHITQKVERGNLIENPPKKKKMRLFTKNSSKKKKLDLFNSTLEEIMIHQKKIHPNIKIPYIIKYLSDKVIELEGNQTVGIFRISISNDLKDKLTEQLKSFDFNLDTKDPHVPAVLLKHFLRSLKEPLIPFYEQAVLLADNNQDVDQNYKTSFKKIKMLWELCNVHTREVILFLADFIENLSKPEYVEKTKMSIENLVTIFSPVILNNPSLIPENLLASQPKEERFAHLLLKYANMENNQKNKTKKELTLNIAKIKISSTSAGDTPRLKRLK